jgi:hypothetical protein
MISGIIIDSSTNKPLKGVKLTSFYGDAPLTSVTDSNGKFTIDTPSFPNNITISCVNYATKEVKPFKGDGEIKTDLGVQQLIPLKQDISKDLLNSSQMSPSQVDSLLKSKKDANYYTQKRLSDTVKDIKSQLIPIAIGMVAEFGLSNVSTLITKSQSEIQRYVDNSTCPTPDELNKLLNTKNKLYKKINNISNTIDVTTKALGITTGILGGLNIALQVFENLPIPVAVAGVGLPMNVITKVQDSIKKLEGTITKLSAISAGSLIILVSIRQVLTQLMQYLSLLDMLIQHCAPDTPQAQETLNKALLDLTKEAEQQSVITPPDINGFILSVETEITEKPLKRKRAIAKNKSGVNLLQGEWSFSSIDQILIDELTFYIQTNNLKAY